MIGWLKAQFRKFISAVKTANNDEMNVIYELLKFNHDREKIKLSKLIAVFEFNPSHQELVPAVIYYFNQLGYHVDLFLHINNKTAKNRSFDNFLSKYCPDLKYNIYRVLNPEGDDNRIYNLINKENYEFYFYNSFFEDWGKTKKINIIRKYLKPKKSMAIRHSYNSPNLKHYNENRDIYEDIVKIEHSFPIAEHLQREHKANLLTCSYFGKNDNLTINKVHFLSVGGIDLKRREYNTLIRICNKLNQMGYKDKFEINFAGYVPNDGYDKKEFFDFVDNNSNVNFYKNIDSDDMLDLARNSDFYLFLLNEEIEENQDYFNGKTTGGYGMTLGNNLIPVLQTPFARHWEFDDIAVSYKDENEFFEKMKDILDNTKKYEKLKKKVMLKNEKLLSKSIASIKSVIENI